MASQNAYANIQPVLGQYLISEYGPGMLNLNWSRHRMPDVILKCANLPTLMYVIFISTRWQSYQTDICERYNHFITSCKFDN